MNMTPNDPRTKASTCKSLGTQPENSEAWIARIQALTVKETTSKAHMQVHTNKESCEKQPRNKPGPNRAETGLGRPAWADRPSPSRARFDAPFDLAVIRTIYSPLAKSHGEIHSSSAAEEQRRQGHRSVEERVEMVDLGSPSRRGNLAWKTTSEFPELGLRSRLDPGGDLVHVLYSRVEFARLNPISRDQVLSIRLCLCLGLLLPQSSL
jgi:hypothetical protein